jgi:4-hydroxybenzoate polyprenyltransferase
MILVRYRAWWLNKVPLSVFLGVSLLAGNLLTLTACAAILTIVGTVCCAANYGYALNELFDMEEDRRGGRPNAAANVPLPTMWMTVGLSGAGALAMATAAGGLSGLALTAAELMLPLAYSIPPLRVKERGWLGIVSDALAAHVYPAMLAVVIVRHLGLADPTMAFTAIAGLWALATGLRGIISHQLQSVEHDQVSRLSTIVHRIGHRQLASFVVFLILPAEVLCFTAMIVQFNSAWLMFTWASYVTYECLKSALDVFPVIVFTRRGQRYVPFVDEGFYKVWGPLTATLAAGVTDLLYLSLLPLCLVLFRPRILEECDQVRATADAAYGYFGGAAART